MRWLTRLVLSSGVSLFVICFLSHPTIAQTASPPARPLAPSAGGRAQKVNPLPPEIRSRIGGELADRDKDKRVTLTTQRLNLHAILSEVARQSDIQVIAAPYYKPRSMVRTFNERGQRLEIQDEPLRNVLDFLAFTFGYQWRHEKGVYIFENRSWFEDDAYFVRDETRQFAERFDGNRTFRYLAHYLKLTREQRESLAEQHPEVSLVLPESLRYQEIAAYLALPEGVRERLDKGERVSWTEIPLSKDKLARLVQQRVRGITPEQLRGMTFWLEKDKQGTERLMFTGAFPAETSSR